MSFPLPIEFHTEAHQMGGYLAKAHHAQPWDTMDFRMRHPFDIVSPPLSDFNAPSSFIKNSLNPSNFVSILTWGLFNLGVF